MKNLFVKTMLASVAVMMCLSGCGQTSGNEDKEQEKDRIEESMDKDKNGKKDADGTAGEDTEEDVRDVDSEIEEVSMDAEEFYDYDDDNDEEEERERQEEANARAEAVMQNIDCFLTALKNGDIDTLLPYLEDDTDMKEILENVKDKEAMGELMRILFVNVDWVYAGNCKEELAEDLIDGDDSSIVKMYICGPMQLYYNYYYTASLPEGTVLPDDYVPASEEEAKAIIEKMVNLTPTIGKESLSIDKIQEDGSFVVDIDILFHMDHSGLEDASYAKGDQIYRVFVREVIDMVADCSYGMGGHYEKDDEIMQELLSLILAKDFDTLAGKSLELNGTEPSMAIKYEDLTEEQKKIVDDILANDVEITYSANVNVSSQKKGGAIIASYPAKYLLSKNLDYIDWVDAHNVKEVCGELESLSNVKSMSNFFLYYYSRIMKYISE